MGEFEKDIRDLFVDLEVNVDTDDLWKGIERKLDKRDRKHPVWWFLIPATLLLLLTTVYFISKNDNYSNKEKEKIANSNIINSDIKKTNITNSKEIINDISNNLTDNNNKKSLKIATTELPNKGKSQNNIKKVNNIAKYPTHKKASTLVAISKTALDPVKDYIPIEDNVDFEQITKAVKTDVNQIKTRELIVLNQMFGYKRNLKSIRKDLNYNYDFTYYDRKHQNKSKAQWQKNLDIGLGLALVSKSLIVKDNIYKYYKEDRESTESYLEAINSNIAFNIQHESGFFVSTGINYTQIDERFLSKGSVDIYTNKAGVTKEIVNSDGTVTQERGQVEVLEKKKWDKEIYNYYYFIDIPISLGYAFDIKRVKIELSSGLSYNLAFMKKGQIIGVDEYPVDIAKEKDLFRSNSILNLISSLKVVYPIKNHLFYLEPNIKYNLKSVTVDENPLEQKYFNYGLKLGTRFSF